MQGAVLLYNLMLAEADKRDSVDEFRARIGEWGAELQGHAREIAEWNLDDFWALSTKTANVHPQTRAFVNQWLELRAWQDAKAACDSSAARSFIKAREQRLKGPRARLTNARALELWGGESGTARLNYRWPTAYRILTDILEPLTAGGKQSQEVLDA
jgi:hypothetical protein